MSYDPIAHGARCDLCPLRGKPVVPPEGSASPKLIVIGEGPGHHEERFLRPFVGLSGKLLDKTLRDNGVSRAETYLTNAALCRGDSDKEKDTAAECCAPRLLRELAAFDASIPLLTLGKPASKSVLNTSRILYARGFHWQTPVIDPKHVKVAEREGVRKGGKFALRAETLALRAAISGRDAFPSISPSFALRAETWAVLFELDVARACRFVGGVRPMRDDIGEWVWTGGATAEEVRAMLDSLSPVVSLDIETDGIKPTETKMLCCGISGGRTIVIWPWKEDYAAMLSAWLRTRTSVVAHNGYQFDQIVLSCHGVK